MRPAGVALVGTEARIDAIDGLGIAPAAFAGLVTVVFVQPDDRWDINYRDRTIMGGLRPSPAVPRVDVPRPKAYATSRRE